MEDGYPEIPQYIIDLFESGEEMDEILLDANGCWFHNRVKFTNQLIIDFFNKSVDITKDGRYVISYSIFVYPITVEDAPVFITGVRILGAGNSEKVHLSLSTGEDEMLDPDSLYLKNDCLYCYIRNGRMPAKFKWSPSFQILERIQENEDIYYLDI